MKQHDAETSNLRKNVLEKYYVIQAAVSFEATVFILTKETWLKL